MSDVIICSTSTNINDTDNQSVAVDDNLGNLVTRTWRESQVPEKKLKRSEFNVNTGNQMIIDQSHQNQDKIICR